MLLENKIVVIYGWGEFISCPVAWTVTNVTSGMFPGCMTPASTTTQRQGKAAR